MLSIFGSTRSVVAHNYALLTPQGFVSSAHASWSDAQVVVAISPRMGAQFTQLLVTLGAHGRGSGTGAQQAFVLVLEGQADLIVGEELHRLAAGGYAYLPPDQPFEISGAGAQLLLFQKPFVPLAGQAVPELLVGSDHDVAGTPFLGDDAALLKLLLPDVLAFDMAVNIFTFQPGATLPIVETHVMEHGLLMLQGQGIYRLGADWHPVQAGDVIWMAPFCPQWFVATGKTAARYVYYKDVNR
ncbi:MAG: (S)-ureidoglycine aminohydrolase [Roseiflexaceae bacterium]|nr:(S)-ureidoglycine aminohydrolase [Roseiflexaceae bacterium]